MKHPNLPQHIIKVPKSRFFYIDTKTGKRIHKSNLASHIQLPKPEIERWDMKYDNY